jgi:hypothetical protein
MGAGASFDNGLATSLQNDRFFCHSCNRIFGLERLDANSICPSCGSSFVESIEGSGNHEIDLFPLRHRNHGNLTIDQARRIANATAMLRLLENQLREELESLHNAFEAASLSLNDNRPSKKSLTHSMKCRLRNCQLSVDLICSQPSCPICNEDFKLDLNVLRLPCTHFFHRDCVLPWLEMKQNCPICRAELEDNVPSVEELSQLTVEEVDERLRGLNVEVVDLYSKER